MEKLFKELTNGNPGAHTVLYELVDTIDYNPNINQNVSLLKELNIKGSKLWTLYKKVCLEDIFVMIEILDLLYESEYPDTFYYTSPYHDNTCINVMEYIKQPYPKKIKRRLF